MTRGQFTLPDSIDAANSLIACSWPNRSANRYFYSAPIRPSGPMAAPCRMPVAELSRGWAGQGGLVVDKGFDDEPSALINLQRISASRHYKQRPAN